MSIFRVATAVFATSALAACEMSQEAATNSGFRTPGASGFITSGVDSDGQEISRSISDGNEGGFAYIGGTNDDGLAAYAGLIAGTTGGDVVASGTGTYDATFSAIQITGINLVDIGLGRSEISGFPRVVNGGITLTADFDTGRLTGTSSGGTLSVDGRIGGGDLSGSVTYLGVDGDLDGVIGVDRTVGAFHGNNEDTIFAGGFAGNAR